MSHFRIDGSKRNNEVVQACYWEAYDSIWHKVQDERAKRQKEKKITRKEELNFRKEKR